MSFKTERNQQCERQALELVLHDAAAATYEWFPWAAAVDEANPLKLDLVFDDRYFMTSNELNLLNTLLLARDEDASASGPS